MSRYTLVIGNKNYSSWSLRPWIAMKQAGLDFEEILIPLYESDGRSGALDAMPAGKVPVLKTPDGEIWDSLAIMEYLNDAHPDAGLWPTDQRARAVARSVACEMHSGFFGIRNDMSMNMRKTFPNFKPKEACQKDIDRILLIWETCRQNYGQKGPFLFGDFSIADAMYAPVASRFTTYHIPMSDVAKAYVDTLMNLPAIKEWAAAGAAEPWVIDVAEVDA